jgi:hypothetical protein
VLGNYVTDFFFAAYKNSGCRIFLFEWAKLLFLAASNWCSKNFIFGHFIKFNDPKSGQQQLLLKF